ncbi:MAG: PorP/SprF family type IX secretion system membrane protein [Flavobacteriales bacterium]|nr:PorP/SprF family type IX secretion system membrane protein [Flavobacteriales bacterium]
MNRSIAIRTARNVLTAALLMGSSDMHGQDAHFSQLFASPIYLNPAMAGGSCARITASTRVQWLGLTAPFHTHQVSVDVNAPGLMGAWGVLASYDDAGLGIIKTSSMSGVYAYATPVLSSPLIGTIELRAGFQAGFLNKSLNADRLISRDQVDRAGWTGFTLPSSDIPAVGSVFAPDLAAGGLLSAERTRDQFVGSWYVAAAFHHLLPPNVAFGGNGSTDPLPRRTTFQGGFSLNVSVGKFAPSRVLAHALHMEQGGIRETMFGAYMDYDPFMIGLWRRSKDAIALSIGWQSESPNEVNDHIIGISYDLTTSRLRTRSGGALELTYQIHFNGCTKRIRALPCSWDPNMRRIRSTNEGAPALRDDPDSPPPTFIRKRDEGKRKWAKKQKL